MKIKEILLVFTAVLSAGSCAQINTAMMYDPHFTTYASHYLPGRLGTGAGLGEINAFPFMNAYVYASSNSAGLDVWSIRDMIANGLTTSQVNRLISQMKSGNSNRFFFGAELQLFSLSFKIRNKETGNEMFSMKIEERERLMGSLQCSKDMLVFAAQGNAQYEGKTMTLDTRLNAAYLHELNIGASVPITVSIAGSRKKLTIRPAGVFKVLIGTADVSMPKGQASMYTAEGGRYLDFNYNYRGNVSYIDYNSMTGILKGAGLGFAGDIGLNLNYADFIIADIGVTDIGKVVYKTNARNYYNTSSSYRFDGVPVSLFSPDGLHPQINGNYLSSLQAEFNPAHTSDKYSVNLGAKLTAQGEVRLQKRERETKKGETNIYYHHRFFFTYVQGFANTYNATTTPYFSGAYMYSFRNIINVGLSAGAGGYNKYNFGAFISFKGGPFMFGLGSNNLSGLIPKHGSGIDGYFNMGFNF